MHLFRNVQIDDLEKLVESCESIHYSIAQSICNQGDQATNALILIDGKLEVSIRTENTVRHVGEISRRNFWRARFVSQQRRSKCDCYGKQTEYLFGLNTRVYEESG